MKLFQFVALALLSLPALSCPVSANGGEPDKQNTAADALYVCDQDGSRLIVLDTNTDQITHVILTPKGPAIIAKSQSGHKVFLTHPDIGELSVFDTRTNDLSGRYVVSGEPFGVVGLDDNSLAYSDWKSGMVTKYNLAAAEISAQVYVGHAPANMVHDEKHKRIYVAVREDNAIAVIDEDNFSLVAKVPVGEAPFAITLDADATRIFVANVRSGTVSVVKTDDLTSSAQTFEAGKSPYGLAISANDHILVTDQADNSLRVFNLTTVVQESRWPVGRYPEGIVIDQRLNRAYVANWFSGDISVFDVQAQKKITSIPTGGGPRSLVLIRSHS